MKKKIAVYVNGWSLPILRQALEGMKQFAKEQNQEFDIFVFMNHASYSEYVDINQGELNISYLAYMEDFDGVVVFSSQLNSESMATWLCNHAKELGLPVVSIGMEMEGIPFVGVDNATGMRELVQHMIDAHSVKRVAFIGGTADHPDSSVRLQVTREVLEKNGLVLRDEDVHYADWSLERAMDIVHGMIASEEGLPDLIVCANDSMALSILSDLTQRGYHLPEDVAVTGFDNIESGQVIYPALTTVAQNYRQVGYECCAYIYEEAAKEEKNSTCFHKMVPTGMVHGESCGCKNPIYEEKRRVFCGIAYRENNHRNLLDQRIRILQNGIIQENRNYEIFRKNMKIYYKRNHTYEGENFWLVMDRQYFSDVMVEISELKKRGTRAELDVIVAMEKGEIIPQETVDHHELIPGYHQSSGEPRTFYFLPLHVSGYNYGYFVIQDEPLMLKLEMIHPYTEKLKQAFENLRVNMRLDMVNQKLTQIYDKDPMTGLFNRFGYEDKAIPLFEQCHGKHSLMMVMFVDINYMKRINDQFGHIHGDNAIRIVADSIWGAVKEDWIPVRFGGDEFLIIAPVCGKECAETAKASIRGYLEKKNQDGSIPYQISASCGYVLTDPDSDKRLEDYIREADALMYEIKREVHAKDEKR